MRLPIPAVITIFSVLLVVGVFGQPPGEEKQVRQAVESFYADFNAHKFDYAG